MGQALKSTKNKAMKLAGAAIGVGALAGGVAGGVAGKIAGKNKSSTEKDDKVKDMTNKEKDKNAITPDNKGPGGLGGAGFVDGSETNEATGTKNANDEGYI